MTLKTGDGEKNFMNNTEVLKYGSSVTFCNDVEK
jgi:hypothetical protein